MSKTTFAKESDPGFSTHESKQPIQAQDQSLVGNLRTPRWMDPMLNHSTPPLLPGLKLTLSAPSTKQPTGLSGEV